jgi:hypothetical protein
MDLAQLQDLIDRLGEDMASWPAEQRAAAEALLLSSGEARERLAAAQRLRAALAAPPVRAPAGLADRILAAARRPPADAGDDDRAGPPAPLPTA